MTIKADRPSRNVTLSMRVIGTMYQGLDLDERPEQDASPMPYLTLRELLAFNRERIPTVFLLGTSSAAASAPARSEARTDALPAAETKPEEVKLAPRFFDLRRCSTADQSGLPEFEQFSQHGD